MQKVIYKPEMPSDELAFRIIFCLFVLMHMLCVKKSVNDDDWTGWLQWMKHCFKYGSIGDHWKSIQSEGWSILDFENFVNKEIILKPGCKPTTLECMIDAFCFPHSY